MVAVISALSAGKKDPQPETQKPCLTLFTPIFRLTSMELTQIHDLIIQLSNSLLKKKRRGHIAGDVSAETFFDWLIKMDSTP